MQKRSEIIIGANYVFALNVFAKGSSSVQVERLFDRFYTVETARRSKGIRLSTDRTLVEQMGGSISADHLDN